MENMLKLPTCLVGTENKIIKDQVVRIIELEKMVMDQAEKIRELEQKIGG